MTSAAPLNSAPLAFDIEQSIFSWNLHTVLSLLWKVNMQIGYSINCRFIALDIWLGYNTDCPVALADNRLTKFGHYLLGYLETV